MQPHTINGKKTVTYSSHLNKKAAKPLFLIAALTHEVRNPLTNINLAVELLQHSLTSDEQRSYLDMITRATQRISTLITELAGEQQRHHEKEGLHSLHKLLDEVLVMTNDRLRLKNIRVVKDYFKEDHNLAQQGMEMQIALTNIIINAIDAMNEQEGVLKLSTSSIDGSYSLIIEDNGCGISPEDMEHIFKPFFTRKKDGLGIGLATTYEILKANNVKVAIESEEGKGTKFILSFLSPVFLETV